MLHIVIIILLPDIIHCFFFFFLRLWHFNFPTSNQLSPSYLTEATVGKNVFFTADRKMTLPVPAVF